jgi:hypothetical protein
VTPKQLKRHFVASEDQIRRVTLALARTKVEWGEFGAMDMFRRMAINVIDSANTRAEIDDGHAKAYDLMIERMGRQ